VKGTVASSFWESLEAAHSGDLPLHAFEQWVCENPALEKELGLERYLELAGFDFRQSHAVHELRKLIERFYAELRPGELAYDFAQRTAEQFLAGQRDLWSTAHAFTRLWHEGHEDWVSSEFVYVDSELDTFPAPSVRPLWDSKALKQLLRRQEPILAEYDRALRESAKAVLDYLAKRRPAP
jgi:hypothetical protein